MNGFRRRAPQAWNPYGHAEQKRNFAVSQPPRCTATALCDLLGIYEGFGPQDIRDPRGHRVLFTALDRFPHMIELKEPDGKTDLRQPQREVEKIKRGGKDNSHFGGYHALRAATLTWIPATVKFPTVIAVRSSLLSRPGNELYYKHFDNFGGNMTVLVCRRVGPHLLVPVTWYPIDRGPNESEIVYHSLPIK
jgi:hypothetical protein